MTAPEVTGCEVRSDQEITWSDHSDD